MRKRIYLLLLTLCLGLFGCGQREVEQEDFTAAGEAGEVKETEDMLTLSMRIPETLNPLLNRDETVDRILKLIYLPLLDFDDAGRAYPAIGESWTFGEDGKTLTMQLRNDILWQNGGKLTAADVVYSFRTIQNAPEASVYQSVLRYVADCTQMGENTVIFTFHESFSDNLSALRFPIISENYYKGNHDPAAEVNQTPMGNGAYAQHTHQQASELILYASETYGGEQPQIARIRVKITAGEDTDIHAFERGMTDVLVTDAMEAGRYADEGVSGMYQYASNAYDFIGFNFRKEMFQDKALRQAVAYALPKESLMESVYLHYGEMTNTPIHPKSWLYEENVAQYDHNPSMASTFLKNSGWTDEDGNGILEKEMDGQTRPLKAVILFNQENTGRKQIASRLKEELTAIGFDITLDQQPFAVYQQKFMEGNYDIVIGGWDCSEITDLTPFFGTAGSLNYIGYTDAEVDQLLLAARSAVGEGATLLAYSSLQKKLAEELPYISIAYRNEAVFVSKNVGGTISPTAFNVFRGIENWTYEKGE
ncbi:MAG: ABC transporter substrate-binding protein [Bacillota bacterium]|nr:ABC transporter substrate-binding protein [Bacillota bacterium]